MTAKAQVAASERKIRVVGCGVMGLGIAQLASASGFTVELADADQSAVSLGPDRIAAMFEKMVAKGQMTQTELQAAKQRLIPVNDPFASTDCYLVIEAVIEDLEVKREVFRRLEAACPAETIFATNTSSMQVTAIGSSLDDPSRLIGLHFFNPVPLMRLVEVIPGMRTSESVSARMVDLVERLGHVPVVAQDMPGFLVNHTGRGLVTEALQLLEEAIASPQEIDRISRDILGLKMGPFELLDLTGLDVSHPVLEEIWAGFYADPRLRPSRITRLRYEAGLFGRKSGEGFYSYPGGIREDDDEPALLPPYRGERIWTDSSVLAQRLTHAGVSVDGSARPNDDTAVIMLSPYGMSTVQAAKSQQLPLDRVCGVDPYGDFEHRITLAVHPGLLPSAGTVGLAALATTRTPVTIIRDCAGMVAQRLVASIVNTGCRIAEYRLAQPQDIDIAARLGLGYPMGPLEWGDRIGTGRILEILRGLLSSTGDPRYRASPWLVARAELDIELTKTGTSPADLFEKNS